jgi:RimJ/RimL family protein N-acetyltransferase
MQKGSLRTILHAKWNVHNPPFPDGDPRWLRGGDKNISFVLANYLNHNFEYVIFSSVLGTYESIREPILKDISAFTAKNYTTVGFTLTCSEETLTERYNKRGDDWGLSFHWLHLDPYPNDYIINTDDKTVEQIVNEIKNIVDTKPQTLETERLVIKNVASSTERCEWDIAEKHTGNLTGKIAFFDIDKKRRSCTIGYHTEEEHQNKGYMTEALTCVLRYMILEAGFNRISGGHQADNPASGRVMEKAGMKCEGKLRQDFMNDDGTVVDSILCISITPSTGKNSVIDWLSEFCTINR